MGLPTPPDTPQASGQPATQTHSAGAAEGSANDAAIDTPLPPPQQQQHHQQRHLGPQQVPPTPETPIASHKHQSRQDDTAASIKSPSSPSPGSESRSTPASTPNKPANEDEADDDNDDDDVELIPRNVPLPATHPHPRRKWRKQRSTFTLDAADYGSPEAARSMPPSPHSATEAVPFKPRRGSRGTGYEESRQAVVPGRMPSKRVAAEPKSRGLRVKLKMNLEVEITLKAQLHGDLLLTVL